ncbi:MAG: 50S ribosomal protein L13 [Clostridia bacterium]|nr:50S ribosomal protein L13 [Oscillospiraceae bacterium]MBQ7033212.1 50S ribosomal protein L13 [Clostridia bacterium]
MSSFMAKPSDVKRSWYIIDAAGKPVGRVAAIAATLLRGKHKPTYTPHVDCGDHVIVINCNEAVFTGKKLDQKSYYRHSGYVGGLKETSARAMMRTNADRAMFLAIRGMVPDTTIGREALTRLRVYKDAEHKHAAQKPEVWE